MFSNQWLDKHIQLAFAELMYNNIDKPHLESKNARWLMHLTCAAESDYGYFNRQVNGPATSAMMLEPATITWLWESVPATYTVPMMRDYGPNQCISHCGSDIQTAIIFARMRYAKDKDPIPDHSEDAEGLAMYWKRVYNTEHGKGKVENAMAKWKRYVQPYYLREMHKNDSVS